MPQCNFYVSDDEREYLRKEFPSGPGGFLREIIRGRMNEDPMYIEKQAKQKEAEADALRKRLQDQAAKRKGKPRSPNLPAKTKEQEWGEWRAKKKRLEAEGEAMRKQREGDE